MKRPLIALAVAALLAAPLSAAAFDELPPDMIGVDGAAWDPDGERLWVAASDAEVGKLVGFNQDGGLDEITFDATPEDVTALSIHKGALYVGDVGDSDGSRDEVVVYRLSNARPGPTKFTSYRLTYPSGAPDAQAIAVSPKGNLYIITSGSKPGVYRAPATLSSSSANKLKRVADAPAGVTDAVFLEDGRTIAMRTADQLRLYDAYEWELKITETFTGEERREALALWSDGLIYVSDQGIREADVPAKKRTTEIEAAVLPEPTDSEPAQQPAESPGETSTDEAILAEDPTSEAAEEEAVVAEAIADGVGPTNTGTVVALILSSVVALAAGTTVFFMKS